MTSVTSYNNADRYHEGDLDFLAQDILRQDQESDSKTFNQEIRFRSNESSSSIKWDFGALYQASDKFLLTRAYADFGYFTTPPAPTGQLTQTNFATRNATAQWRPTLDSNSTFD